MSSCRCSRPATIAPGVPEARRRSRALRGALRARPGPDRLLHRARLLEARDHPRGRLRPLRIRPVRQDRRGLPGVREDRRAAGRGRERSGEPAALSLGSGVRAPPGRPRRGRLHPAARPGQSRSAGASLRAARLRRTPPRSRGSRSAGCGSASARPSAALRARRRSRRPASRADRRPAADRQEEEVDLAERRGLLVAQRALAEVAEVRDAQPVERRRRRSCSGRARCRRRRRARRRSPTTSPIGDSRRPGGRAQRSPGRPPIASTPLWSRCSWVTSRRSAVTPVDRRVLPAASRAPRQRRHVVEGVDEDRRRRRRSGGTRTVRTTQRCMLLLQFACADGGGRCGGRLVDVVDSARRAAARPRRRSGRRRSRTRTRRASPSLERAGDQAAGRTRGR